MTHNAVGADTDYAVTTIALHSHDGRIKPVYSHRPQIHAQRGGIPENASNLNGPGNQTPMESPDIKSYEDPVSDQEHTAHRSSQTINVSRAGRNPFLH